MPSPDEGMNFKQSAKGLFCISAFEKSSKSKVEFALNECGAVFMELAIILPIVVFLTVVVTDFGLFLQSYMRVSHIAREGLKYAQAMAELPSGTGAYQATYKVDSDLFALTAPIDTYPAAHQMILRRVAMLLTSENGSSIRRSLQLVNDLASVSAECIPGPGGNRDLDKVELIISATYDPILPVQSMLAAVGLGAMPTVYSVKAEGNYLYAQCA